MRKPKKRLRRHVSPYIMSSAPAMFRTLDVLADDAALDDEVTVRRVGLQANLTQSVRWRNTIATFLTGPLKWLRCSQKDRFKIRCHLLWINIVVHGGCEVQDTGGPSAHLKAFRISTIILGYPSQELPI